MKFLIISILIILYFNSCKKNNQYKYLENICIKNLDIKLDTIRKKASYSIRANNQYLSLKDIDGESDTFYLRIEYAPDSVDRIFEFTYHKSKTTFKVYNFPTEYPSGFKILFDNKKDKLIDFTTKFDSKGRDYNFINELEKSNLLELSSSANIKNYPEIDYRHYYEVQFSSKCKYNFYTFGGAFENSSRFTEARQFANFLKYLQKEFNF